MRWLIKLWHTIRGKPYFYVDMEYHSQEKAVAMKYDYNKAMIVHLEKQGFGVDGDPEATITNYMNSVYDMTRAEEEMGTFEDDRE